jgi:hypothetical protein
MSFDFFVTRFRMLDKQSKIIWLMKKWILFAQSMLIIYYILVFVVNFYYVVLYATDLPYMSFDFRLLINGLVTLHLS